ncbi:hypothetical protein [Butyrivibrio sp. AD3002]|uniref:hypothetical protein n=1 Tax=Butyrivibrio sp. AD3002 TaxID=1280670 RepID=UPI000425D1EA|nr:hypothetical protein [Butyrivibrio sp. AD3002]
MAFWFIAAKCDGLSVDPRDFGLKEGELAKIFAVGLPASVTNFTQTLGITLTNRAFSATWESFPLSSVRMSYQWLLQLFFFGW